MKPILIYVIIAIIIFLIVCTRSATTFITDPGAIYEDNHISLIRSNHKDKFYDSPFGDSRESLENKIGQSTSKYPVGAKIVNTIDNKSTVIATFTEDLDTLLLRAKLEPRCEALEVTYVGNISTGILRSSSEFSNEQSNAQTFQIRNFKRSFVVNGQTYLFKWIPGFVPTVTETSTAPSINSDVTSATRVITENPIKMWTSTGWNTLDKWKIDSSVKTIIINSGSWVRDDVELPAEFNLYDFYPDVIVNGYKVSGTESSNPMTEIKNENSKTTATLFGGPSLVMVGFGSDKCTYYGTLPKKYWTPSSGSAMWLLKKYIVPEDVKPYDHTSPREYTEYLNTAIDPAYDIDSNIITKNNDGLELPVPNNMNKPNVNDLIDTCNTLNDCVAFTSNGIFRRSVPPIQTWNSDIGNDLYVAEKYNPRGNYVIIPGRYNRNVHFKVTEKPFSMGGSMKKCDDARLNGNDDPNRCSAVSLQYLIGKNNEPTLRDFTHNLWINSTDDWISKDENNHGYTLVYKPVLENQQIIPGLYKY